MPSLLPSLAATTSNISPIFALLATVLAVAIILSLILVKLRQSLLVGYLLAGVLISNAGLTHFVSTDEASVLIADLSEIGIVLLMFTLGIEFSLKEFRHLLRPALIGGSLQVVATASLVGIGAYYGLHFSTPNSIVLGLAVALSSTAVAMKSFQDSGQSHHPGARASLGIALFQDILVIVFFLVMPALFISHSEASNLGQLITFSVAKGLLFLVAAGLFGYFGINPLLHMVAQTRSRELFTLSVIGLCAGVAFAGHALDLSLALGAFTAGLVVSESIYSHRILSDILPFKDLFMAIFFVSVGLLIDVHAIIHHWQTILFLTFLILTLKGMIVYASLRIIKIPARSTLLAAASLASTGEFSLVLIGKIGGNSALDPTIEQLFLICTATSMAIIPTLMRSSIPFALWLEKHHLIRSHQHMPARLTSSRDLKEICDHAIIVGYGPVGRAVQEALSHCGTPTVVMELNADTVKTLKKQGQPVLFADVTHPEALDIAGIQRARMIVFTFPLVDSICTAVPLIRERNRSIQIIARARYSNDAERLTAMNLQIIHDERETAISMVDAVVNSYDRIDVAADQVVAMAISNPD